MDLVLLESLLAVADTGTITGAADRVHVSQSALSRRLQQLEAELGAELLVRGRHGAELTPIGSQALTHARSIVARVEQMRGEVADHLALRKGTVTVGGGATVTSFLLPPAIAAFQRDHPDIRFRVKEAGSEEVAREVSSGDIELGIVTLPIRTPDVHVRPFVVDDIVLVSRHDHPLAGRTVTAGELTRHSFISFEPGSAIRQIIDARLQRAGVEPEVAMELRSIPSILRMVATTSSLAFVSRLSVASEPAVRILSVRGLALSRRLGLATRAGFPLSPATAGFVTTLTDVSRESLRVSGARPTGRGRRD